jgi:hypothetical protein
MAETYTVLLNSRLNPEGFHQYSSIVWTAGNERSGGLCGTKTFKDENELRSVLTKIFDYGPGIDNVLHLLRSNGQFASLPPVNSERAKDFGWGASG